MRNLPFSRVTFSQAGLFLASLLVCLTVIISDVAAQSDTADPLHDLLTTRRLSECADYTFNAQLLIPRYHREEKFDSIEMIINYVYAHCQYDPFKSYSTLRDIEAGTIPLNWCDTSIANEIFSYRSYGYSFGNWTEEMYWARRGIARADTTYWVFIESLATRVQEQLEPSSFEAAVALYYAGEPDSVLRNLSRRRYDGSCLQWEYDRLVDSLVARRKRSSWNLSLNIGIWIPTGNNAFLGPKAEIGGQAGIRRGRLGADLTILFRFLDSQDPYVVGYKGKLYTTDQFQAIYIGIEPNWMVYSATRSRLEIFGGIGWDGMMGLTPDIIDSDAGDYMNSFNFNVGVTQRLFYGKRHTKFFGIQARYNMVDYDSDGGTDLSGNTISICLLWGDMSHDGTDDYLDALHYFDR